MATAPREVALQAKREIPQAHERTEAGKFYSPYTDIYETKDAVIVAMEVPGVDKAGIDIKLDKDQLTISSSIDSKRYEALAPIYSEYNVGNFVRTFTLSTKIDREAISATVADGVLTVRLPKAAEPVAKRIAVN